MKSTSLESAILNSVRALLQMQSNLFSTMFMTTIALQAVKFQKDTHAIQQQNPQTISTDAYIQAYAAAIISHIQTMLCSTWRNRGVQNWSKAKDCMLWPSESEDVETIWKRCECVQTSRCCFVAVRLYNSLGKHTTMSWAPASTTHT